MGPLNIPVFLAGMQVQARIGKQEYPFFTFSSIVKMLSGKSQRTTSSTGHHERGGVTCAVDGGTPSLASMDCEMRPTTMEL